MRLPSKDRPTVSGPERERLDDGSKVTVLTVALRTTPAAVAYVTYQITVKGRAAIRKITLEAVDRRGTGSLMRKHLSAISLQEARDAAVVALDKSGHADLVDSMHAIGKKRGVVLHPDRVYLPYAVEYCEARRRDPEHIFREMGRAYDRSEPSLRYAVRQCRTKKLLTKRGALTAKARRLLETHPVTPWSPDR